MHELLKAATQFGLQAIVYVCNIGLERLNAERPMHDEPLPENHLPDELWTPPGGTRPGTLIFDGPGRPDQSGFQGSHVDSITSLLKDRAEAHWGGIPYGEPEHN